MAVKVKQKNMKVRERIALASFWLAIALCATFLLGILTALLVAGTAELGEDNTESFYIATWVGVYCGTIFLLGILALFGKPKVLYAKKRYFIVMFAILGILGFYTLGVVGDKSQVVSDKLESVKAQLKEEKDQSSTATDNPLSDSGLDATIPATQVPQEQLSGPRDVAEKKAECESLEEIASIGAKQSDADSLYRSYEFDKAHYDGWEIYTEEEQQAKIAASYQKYLIGVEASYQKYKSQVNSNIYCFPQMAKPTIREP